MAHLKGIEIPEAGGRIHPHFGVFAPIRHEYVDLVSTTPLPAACASSSIAFDIGLGAGTLRRGTGTAWHRTRDHYRSRATRIGPPRVKIYRQLGLSERVEVVQTDHFPERSRGARDLQAAMAAGALEFAPLEKPGIYDPDSQMPRGFLRALPAHQVCLALRSITTRQTRLGVPIEALQ